MGISSVMSVTTQKFVISGYFDLMKFPGRFPVRISETHYAVVLPRYVLETLSRDYVQNDHERWAERFCGVAHESLVGGTDLLWGS
jgi:hypothetical protein